MFGGEGVSAAREERCDEGTPRRRDALTPQQGEFVNTTAGLIFSGGEPMASHGRKTFPSRGPWDGPRQTARSAARRATEPGGEGVIPPPSASRGSWGVANAVDVGTTLQPTRRTLEERGEDGASFNPTDCARPPHRSLAD